MKFEFKKTKDLDNRFDITDVTISGESDSLSDIIESFEEFLRACGFVINGSLDLVYESAEHSAPVFDSILDQRFSHAESYYQSSPL